MPSFWAFSTSSHHLSSAAPLSPAIPISVDGTELQQIQNPPSYRPCYVAFLFKQKGLLLGYMGHLAGDGVCWHFCFDGSWKNTHLCKRR